MKYGHRPREFNGPPKPISGSIHTGDVIWADKAGGSMIGRAQYGLHDTAEEAWRAAVAYLSREACDQIERAQRCSDALRDLIKEGP